MTDTEKRLAEALREVVNKYTGLVNSGDCGFWNPEEEQQVINARAALAEFDSQSEEQE